MATAGPSQLFLLADHIKLSLLERQRAISLNLDPNSNDPQISRSLDQLQAGITSLESLSSQWDDPLHPSSDQQDLAEAIKTLKAQYSDLSSTFHSSDLSTKNPSTLTTPNNPSLSSDFDHAQQTKPSKSVRFTDNPDDANRTALFPARYTDDPNEQAQPPAPDQSDLSNTQIHEYHQTVLRDQDAQLDRLGESITRQRDISIAIGDELDEHALMLDEVDERVDRHQGALDRARGRLDRVVKTAKQHWSLVVITILILVLIILIGVTKK